MLPINGGTKGGTIVPKVGTCATKSFCGGVPTGRDVPLAKNPSTGTAQQRLF